MTRTVTLPQQELTNLENQIKRLTDINSELVKGASVVIKPVVRIHYDQISYHIEQLNDIFKLEGSICTAGQSEDIEDQLKDFEGLLDDKLKIFNEKLTGVVDNTEKDLKEKYVQKSLSAEKDLEEKYNQKKGILRKQVQRETT